MEILSALTGAFVAMATTYAPRLYQLLRGRAKYDMDDHRLVTQELREEIARLTGRLDARIAQVDGLQKEAILSAEHRARCDARLEFLEQEFRRVTGAEPSGPPIEPKA